MTRGSLRARVPLASSILRYVKLLTRLATGAELFIRLYQLYSAPFAGVFKDVVTGNNPGCQTEGFVAAPGWDPVGGIGTPNLKALTEAFLALP